MIVRVNEADIAMGRRGNACNCPVALAVRRAVQYKYTVVVDGLMIKLFDQDVNIVRQWYISKGLRTFIQSFDAGMNVEPIHINLGSVP